VIAKAGVPKVTLIPVQRQERRSPGRFAGQIIVADRFFEPLPDEELAAWEGAAP
jgi:antitoxin (DNA-binding transcriptional repressor) of toxin-antitoxin stability system